jgi:hypothetical protein
MSRAERFVFVAFAMTPLTAAVAGAQTIAGGPVIARCACRGGIGCKLLCWKVLEPLLCIL